MITRLSKPVYDVLPMDEIIEYVGFDSDFDWKQDKTLQILREAAIQQGEQVTNTIWAQTEYRVDELEPDYDGLIFLPRELLPVFKVSRVFNSDGEELDKAEWEFRPSSFPSHPWPGLRVIAPVPGDALTVEFTAGWEENELPGSLKNWALIRINTEYTPKNRVDLVTGTITATLPRRHHNGLLDKYTVRY